jgi:hypothetical protein
MHALRTFTATAFALIFAATLARPQSFQTTTVTGTVYAAGGAPVSGSLQISWPAFTTASGQAIAAGHVNVNIPNNGQISVPLAPNIGASPAGLYYTAVYHLSDGTTSTEYWVVPNSIETTIGQIRSKVMPAAQAVQAVSKTYVDQSIAQAVSSQITPSGGTLTGPLYLSGDPTAPSQASNRHYVDAAVAGALPITGGTVAGPVTATKIGAVYQADQFPGADFGAKLQACINALDPNYGGTCDARNFAGSLTMASNLNLSAANATINLPCSTIATAASIVVPAGTRNVTLHGCASRGTSAASGAQGGTVFLYSGNTAFLQVGDPSFVADTKGFRLDNAALNTTAATSASAEAIAIYRTQEVSLAGLYVLGNANQTAIVLDGTGNYTGGTLEDLQITGYQTGVSGIGHTISNPATTDWLNASTLVRVHIDCPTQNGNPIGGTIGIDLNAGDGNTITGGDVESCATALHLGAHAGNNTILGLRNENSTTQIQADPGSSYNNWITGGTMFTGKLVDQGTRNSFLDTFHRSFNGLNGDWWGSQQDATVTNHYRLGTGSGNERGMLDRFQTDSGYRWTTGLSDAAGGIQYYQVLDELNNVNRLSIGQYNSGQPSSNNQTAINAAGNGAVILNGSNNAGTGGVVIGSGGPSSTTVATIDKSGNAHFTGTMLIDQTAQSTGTVTVRNNADAEVDYYLWPGATASQKGSFTYKDFNGASQWYLLKDQNNNWALNSAVGGLDSFKAYQSTNSGDTYINASNAGGHIRLNYETGAGAETDIYAGSSTSLSAAILGPTAIKLPGLAASSGKNCLQIDNAGYITNTTTPCNTGSGNVGTGSAGQIAYYTANGTAIAGTTTVPLSSGGTGAATAAGALSNLLPGVTADGASGLAVQGSALVKGNAQFQGPVAVASGGVTFSDSSVQTTSQQGALTGAANDSVARIAASNAQTAANAALPANGVSTSTASGGSVNVPGAIAAGTTIGIQDGAVYVNANRFGVVCDGLTAGSPTDNTAALNNAFAYIASHHGTLQLPVGQCNVSGTLIIPFCQLVTIKGMGRMSTVIMETSNNLPIIESNVPNTHSISLEDFTLQYQTQQTSSNTASYGLEFTGTSGGSGQYHWRVTNVQITGAYIGVGNYIASGAEPVWGSVFTDLLISCTAQSAVVIGTTVGKPALTFNNLKVFNTGCSSMVSSGPSVSMSGVEAVFNTVDIEGWYGQLFCFGGGTSLAINGFHGENNTVNVNYTTVFFIANGQFELNGGSLSFTNSASTTTIFNVTGGAKASIKNLSVGATITSGSVAFLGNPSALPVNLSHIVDNLGNLNLGSLTNFTQWDNYFPGGIVLPANSGLAFTAQYGTNSQLFQLGSTALTAAYMSFVSGAPNAGWYMYGNASSGNWAPSLIFGNPSGNIDLNGCAAVTAVSASSPPTCHISFEFLYNPTNGSNGYSVKFGQANLTASRMITWPDLTGTVAMTSQLPTKYSSSLTPTAATASSCVEQTFTLTGLTTGQAVLSANPPSALGTHVWIGSVRVSTTNTLAIDFCADATGGTPPSGAWLVTAL